MLLTSFVLLSAFGGALWLLGHYFEFHGVAVIGAVLIIAVGGAAAISDVSVRDGHTIERDYRDFNATDNSTDPVNNETKFSYTTKEVAVTKSLGSLESYALGALTMIAGALLLVQDLNSAG